ncbi:MAG: multiheme c-type cytochrome [Deferribacterota bacterium]|nr:multiheme c-type cytochrome [Deferribacterota bacterium]
MKRISYLLLSSLILVAFFFTSNTYASISKETQTCLSCHSTVTPGIVADWKKSRHSTISPEEATKKPPLKRRVSSKDIPDHVKGNVVGCYECHALNPDTHKDTFNHNGFKIHVVVTPKDCATCHSQEVLEYSKNIMSNAHNNLLKNPVYHNLVDTSDGVQVFDGNDTIYKPADEETIADSCAYCHGTKVEVKGLKKIKTDFGEMEFPILSGWPNQGVGRINPDGSKGSCTSCHTRHQFSIAMARKPATCSECHKGPDVPAYKVYMVSKHGNIYSSMSDKWNFDKVPWVLGEDFSAPTCATCHASLVVDKNGKVIANRTHQMNDRLPWRIFGLPYAHPHPISPDTTIIKNKDGLPLPTELTGEYVSQYLIDSKEMDIRRNNMKNVCKACHSTNWVDNQYARFENTIKTTNEMTLAATKILLKAWDLGVALGLAKGDSIFNEAIEKMWVEQWLFFANSTRFSSAMIGADYGAFANGRWYMSKNIQQMKDWLEFKLKENKE